MKRNYRADVGRGQTLIEVVVAVAVSVMLGVSLLSVGLITQKTARSARNNAQAAKLAQERSEEIRIFRDFKGYQVIATTVGTSTQQFFICKICDPGNPGQPNPEPTTWMLVTDVGLDPPVILSGVEYLRYMIFTQDTSNAITRYRVAVTVTWSEDNNPRSVTNSIELGKWCRNSVPETSGGCTY